MHMEVRASFESLPLETLLQILSQLPDIESLDSVIRASPYAWRLFEKFGVGITENVLNSHHTHSTTRGMIRTISYIRQNKFPITSISELRRRILQRAVFHRGDRYYGEPCDDPFEPTTFPDGSTSSAIRCILATARRIRRLTDECLEFYLGRYRHLEPRYPVDHNYLPKHHSATWVRAENPPTEAVLRKDAGPLTWREEQLVYRAFWRIQFFNELTNVVYDGTFSDWNDRRRLLNMDIIELFDFKQAQDDTLTQHELCEQGLINSALYFLDQLPQSHVPVYPPRIMREPRPEDDEWLMGDVTNGPWAFECTYAYFQSYLDEDSEAFAPFRHRGFAIWTEERLIGYGFIHDGLSERNLQNMLVAWLSVLNPEEYADLERWERELLQDYEIRELEELKRLQSICSSTEGL